MIAIGFAREAVMATINSDFFLQHGRIAGHLETALAALRTSLDAFVSERMRRAAAEAEHARQRRLACAPSPSVDSQ
jgi:hypothetical protein